MKIDVKCEKTCRKSPKIRVKNQRKLVKTDLNYEKVANNQKWNEKLGENR